MFENLLANLPYNPSLVHQLGFYAKRMRGEAAVRRTGVVFLVLAFVVQFFAVVAPPQSTVAASNNDLVNGGFTSAAQAAADCRSNVAPIGQVGYGTILANYGITCDQVANANTISINSREWNGRLYSMGRLPYNLAGETPVTIGGSTVYVRNLWGWDSPGTTSTYQALNVTKPGGQTFLLLYNCGNLTSVGLPVPVAKPPQLSIYKTTSPGGPVADSYVKPGDVLFFRPYFNDTGGAASNVVMSDTQPAYTTYTWMGSGAASSWHYDSASHTAVWNYQSVPAGTVDDYTDVKFQVNADTPNGTKICNVASLSATGVASITSNKVCFTVKVNAPKPTPTPSQPLPPPPAPPAPVKPCQQALSSQDTIACVQIHKTAANLTQQLTNANGSTAQPGNVIQYTLYATNTGTAAVSNYVFQEDLSDVMDYAKVSDTGGGSLQGPGNTVLVWPALTINPGQTVSKQLQVTVDDPIPQTPVSSSDPEHFNLVMTNVYGNTININVPGSPIKSVETASAALPNTGPGSSLLIAAAILVVAGYFFARARLLADESALVMQETTTGGM